MSLEGAAGTDVGVDSTGTGVGTTAGIGTTVSTGVGSVAGVLLTLFTGTGACADCGAGAGVGLETTTSGASST